MSITCQSCKQEFSIQNEEKAFYEKFEVPEPQKCPDCRLLRRLMERNSKNLYYRKCDASGEQTLSQYHDKQPFPVYSPAAWWNDNFEATDYGMEFDFNRGFFDQFKELKHKVPHLALFNTEGTMENSDFNNCAAYIKNCYLVGETDYCENCYYGNLLKKSKDVMDCSVCYECELCYECVDCQNCYNLGFSQDSISCSDSLFLKNCISCKDCIGCINQRQKQYMIFNKQYSQEGYEKIKAGYNLHSRSGIEKLQKEVVAFFKTQPHKALIAEQNQNSLGDHLYNSKNAYYCFDSKDLEDCMYCSKLSMGVKSSMDYTAWGNKSELMYQCLACGDNNYNCRFCVTCQVNMHNCDYCYECFSCQDCFGCVGLKKKQYCILNKQYSKEEYFELKAKIIEHMGGNIVNAGHKDEERTARLRSEMNNPAMPVVRRSEPTNKEWGEFFPADICAFGYNESIAMDMLPLTKEQALKFGFPWKDEEPRTAQPATYQLPDDIQKTDHDVIQHTLQCQQCQKSYKIIPQELGFYQRANLPAPVNCPLCRHQNRMKRRNPLKLRSKPCSNCQKPTYSSYAPNREEKIVCEQCFMANVYE